MSEQRVAIKDGDRISAPSDPIRAKSPYSLASIGLHWIIALAFIVQLGLGWRMGMAGAPDRFAVFQLHKSVGISILLLTLVRVALRLSTPWPALSTTLSRTERVTAHTVHAGFYVLLLGLPLTGWLIVSSSARHIPTYLYGAVPWPNIPGVNALTPALKASLNVVSAGSHEVMAYLACLAIVLHVAGALKHQLVDRDDEMTRMVPVKRSMAGPIAMITLLAAVVLAGLAATGHLSSVAAKLVHRDDQAAGSPLPARSPPSKPTPMPAPAISSPGTHGSSPADSDSAPDRATSSPVDAAEWQVRRSASRLGFQTRWSQGPVEGGFARWEARIRFAPEALAASHVKVTVDLASVTTNSPDTQEALVGDDWFATSLHPTATFVADRFTHLAGDRYAAHGTLSLRGASRPLTLPFALRVKGQVASMQAAVAIDRTSFGIGQGDFQSTGDLPAKVQVTIDLTADRTNPHGDTK